MKQKLSLILIIASLVLIPFFASARGLVPCGGYKDAAGTQREDPCTLTDMMVLVARVTDFLITAAGVYAVFKIIDGGFWLVISLGNEERITKRKGEITDAVVGLVLVMIAYILVNTVVNYILLGSLPANSPLKIDLTNPFKYLSQ